MDQARKPLIAADQFITAPISDGAARVIQAFMAKYRDELDAELKPFGLTINEIAVPNYERLVYADEVKPW